MENDKWKVENESNEQLKRKTNPCFKICVTGYECF
jgi:hypothetical protein